MSDFEIFDLNKSEKNSHRYPDWPELFGTKSNAAKGMYRYVIERRNTIKEELKNGVNLVGKERKIVLSKVSECVGKNASYLNKREFPDLVRFINELNDQLARLTPAGNSPLPKYSMSAAELKVRVSELEEQIRERNFSQLLTERVIAQLGPLRQKNIKIEKENRELTENMHELRDNNADLIGQISDLLTEICDLNNQIKDLGHEPNPKTKMTVVK